MGLNSLSGCDKFIKFLLMLFNFIFFVMGLAIIGLAIYAMTRGPVTQLSSFNAAWALVALGAFAVLFSLLGCCGARRESKCALYTYFTLLTILVIAEITAGILAYEYRDKIGPDLHKGWQQSNTATRNQLQQSFKCCGFYNNTDLVYDAGNVCKPPVQGPASHYADGCYNAIKHDILKNIKIIEGTGISAAVIQVLSVLFSLALACAIGKARKRDEERETLLKSEMNQQFYGNGPQYRRHVQERY